jgi:hypothetical protein
MVAKMYSRLQQWDAESIPVLHGYLKRKKKKKNARNQTGGM